MEEKLTYEQLQQMLVEEYNQRVGNLNETDNIECELCKNKGYIDKIINDDIVSIECSCVKKRKAVRRALASGVGMYIHKTLNDYNALTDWQITCKEKAIDYLNANDDCWFVALGQSGSGKTLLCSIITNSLIMNYDKEVVCVTWTDFISKLKRDMMGDNTRTVSIYLDNIKKCEILFLDEVLKKYNETDLRYLMEIINYRYTNNKKTIITSEKTLTELLDIDEATFGRVIEKSKKYILNIKKDRARNYRLMGIGN